MWTICLRANVMSSISSSASRSGSSCSRDNRRAMPLRLRPWSDVPWRPALRAESQRSSQGWSPITVRRRRVRRNHRPRRLRPRRRLRHPRRLRQHQFRSLRPPSERPSRDVGCRRLRPVAHRPQPGRPPLRPAAPQRWWSNHGRLVRWYSWTTVVSALRHFGPVPCQPGRTPCASSSTGIGGGPPS